MSVVHTSRGWIGLDPPNGDGPCVIVVRGAYPPPDQLADLRAPVPVGFLNLPGFGAPRLPQMALGAFAAAFDEALPNRPVTLLGVSTGAVVALQMTAPQITRIIAVEPFCSTASLGPLLRVLQPQVPRMTRWEAEFTAEVFGCFADRLEDRFYEAQPTKPVVVVVGAASTPLGQMPSLTAPGDIEHFRALGARIVVCDGGHDLPRNNLRAIESCLAETFVRPGV